MILIDRASDANSIGSEDIALDVDEDDVVGPQLDPEPMVVRPHRERRASDRYGFGRVNLRTALGEEQAEIELGTV